MSKPDGLNPVGEAVYLAEMTKFYTSKGLRSQALLPFACFSGKYLWGGDDGQLVCNRSYT